MKDTLATRAEKAFVRIIYSILHFKTPGNLYDNLNPVTHQGRVTHATELGVLAIPRTNTEVGKMGFGYRAPTKWNQTKVEIKSAVNVN